MSQTVQIELTWRELTLIRVAMITRLEKLKSRTDMKLSYEESRALMNGKLWKAVADFHHQEKEERRSVKPAPRRNRKEQRK